MMATTFGEKRQSPAASIKNFLIALLNLLWADNISWLLLGLDDFTKVIFLQSTENTYKVVTVFTFLSYVVGNESNGSY